MKPNFARRPLACLIAFASVAAQAAPVAYVASDGNDNRGRCTLAAPCRTFQVAHDTVDARGQVVAIDTADYGPLTITKSVAIVGSPGAAAGISVAAGNGITVATAGVDVVVRNVQVVGAGGARGIDMSAGRSLVLEGVIVSNMANDGVHVSAAQSLAIVDSAMRGNGRHGAFVDSGSTSIVRSQFIGNGGHGFSLEAGNGGAGATVNDSVASENGDRGFSSKSVLNSSRMTVARSTASRNAGGGFVNEHAAPFADAHVTVAASTATRNGTGFLSTPSGCLIFCLFYSAGDNVVQYNTTDVDGIVAASPLR